MSNSATISRRHDADYTSEHGRGVSTALSEGGVGLPASVQVHLGCQLQAAYAALTSAKLPQYLLDLIAQLDTALAGQSGQAAAAFSQDLLAALPSLRAFALSLVTNAVRADDLVQETVLKAWANQHRFEPGSNLTAWLFTILRNHFYTEIRKRKREVEDADGKMAAEMIAPAGQEHAADLHVIQRQMAKLPAAQREALLLVGAQGLTYEAAAEVMGCQVGTVKSRVSRARSVLVGSLGSDAAKDQPLKRALQTE